MQFSFICCHLALEINFLKAAPELLSSEQIGVGLYYLWILDYRSFTFRIALCALQLLIPSKDNPLIVGWYHVCVMFQKHVT